MPTEEHEELALGLRCGVGSAVVGTEATGALDAPTTFGGSKTTDVPVGAAFLQWMLPAIRPVSRRRGRRRRGRSQRRAPVAPEPLLDRLGAASGPRLGLQGGTRPQPRRSKAGEAGAVASHGRRRRPAWEAWEACRRACGVLECFVRCRWRV